MKLLLFKTNQLLKCDASNGKFKRKSELNDIGLLEDYSILIEDEKIIEITSKKDFDFSQFDLVIDCRNKVVMPGLIDSHTHLIYAGSRADEFEMRLEGRTYEEIAYRGGGIIRTVNATRNTSKEELKKVGKFRLQRAIEFGITTIEIKSGYGLDYETEIKMLECANELNLESPIDIFTTFLGAHSIPPEYKNKRDEYIKILTNDLIPEISKRNLAKFCDVFLEKTAFTVEESKKILEIGKKIWFAA